MIAQACAPGQPGPVDEPRTDASPRKTGDAQDDLRLGDGGRSALLRDTERGAPNTYLMRHANGRYGDCDWLSRWQYALGQRRPGAKAWAIRTVRYRTLVRIRMIVLRVSIGGLVGGAVLDDLAVSANVDVGICEDRGQRGKRYREPCEEQVPTHYHQVMSATVRKYERQYRRCPFQPQQASTNGCLAVL